MTGTRDRIVFAAMDLFHRQGYEATSISDVLAAADANAGSLYHFFPGKEAVLLAVLDAYLAGVWPAVMAPAFARTDDPVERVFEVLRDYRERVRSTQCTYNCPIGSLALEVGHTVPAAGEKLARNFEQWRRAIQECFEAAGERFGPEVDRAGLATLVLTVMEGGVMQARTYRNVELFDASVAQLERYVRSLDSHTPS